LFQSTRPRGARLTHQLFEANRKRFNPRARAGRDDKLRKEVILYLSFNPRARAGRDVSRVTAYDDYIVSIHAPARGATLHEKFRSWRSWFQSTRPRGARPRRGTLFCRVFVSIHAPARGATSCLDVGPHVVIVSIHAPARRATIGWETLCDLKEFQSTRPRGARPGDKAKEAAKNTFQSTRPRGARPSRSPRSTSKQRFQSTRPRGARPG